MPNCDFYATIKDHEVILDYLFAEKECEIYESYSDFERPLKQFLCTEDILAEFDRIYSNGKKWKSVYLQIYVLGAGFDFKVKKIPVNPDKCEGFNYRHRANNFGLIQLYLETTIEKVLSQSHTNHNTQKRAEKWACTSEEIAEVAACDFSKITKFSSKLNRYIKKTSVAKVASSPILPEALNLWNKGFMLKPYTPENSKIEYKNT